MAELKAAKREQFCKEYIIDLNGTQAAIRSGYSEKTANRIASEMLSKPDIQARIAELMQERSNRVRIDADWVLMAAKRVYDRCMQEEPVLEKDGTPVMCTTEHGEIAAAYTFNAAGANKALETIGKHVAVNAFAEKQVEDKQEQITRVIVEVVGADKADSNATAG